MQWALIAVADIGLCAMLAHVDLQRKASSAVLVHVGFQLIAN
jgi:hypothetical protein